MKHGCGTFGVGIVDITSLILYSLLCIPWISQIIEWDFDVLVVTIGAFVSCFSKYHRLRVQGDRE